MVANKSSRYVWAYESTPGSQSQDWSQTDTVAIAIGDDATMTTLDETIANRLAGYKMGVLTGDNVGTVFTIVSNTATSPTIITLSGTPATPGDLTGDLVSIERTYEFGEYNEECGQWNTPFVENPTQPKWDYDSRTPTLIELERIFPVFSHTFNLSKIHIKVVQIINIIKYEIVLSFI